MSKLLWTTQSREDLVEIWVYIAQDNRKAAQKLLLKIDWKCRSLLKSPALGRKREELASNLRSITIGKYVVFYRSIKETIQIIRVLHGNRDVDTIIPDSM